MKINIYFWSLLFNCGLFLNSFTSIAQPTVQWDKTFGGSGSDFLRSSIRTPDGGYLLAGSSESPASGDKSEDNKGAMDWLVEFDYWVVKTDGSGNKVWDKTFGGSGNDYLQITSPTPDGGYLLAGFSASGATGDKSGNSKGAVDYWVVKIDNNGNKIWDKTLGGSGSDYLVSTTPTPDGGYLLGGYSDSNASGDKSEDGRGDWDYWVVKLDGSGNKIWDKTFGGSNEDYLRNVITTPDGGYLLSGDSGSDGTGDNSGDNKGVFDYWVIKIDGNGNKVWDKNFGGSSYDRHRSTTPTTDGGFLLAGYSDSPASGDKSEDSKGFDDYWTVKIDGNGNKIWDKTFGGSADEQLSIISATPDGGYLLAGRSQSDSSGDKSENRKGGVDYWVVKIEGGGNMLWDKTIGGSGDDYPVSIIPSPDGGYLLAGYSNSPASGDKSEDSKGGHDFWVVKLQGEPPVVDPSPTVQWDRTFGGAGVDELSSTVPTPDGGYLMGGRSSSDISGEKSGNRKGSWDYWVVKTDGNGNKIWDKTYGGTGSDELLSISPSPDGGYLLGGYSDSNASGDKSENSKGFLDFWVIKIDGNGSIVWDKTIGGSGSDYLLSSTPTPDGGYLLGGFSDSPISGDKSEGGRGVMDYWVVKIDGGGNKVWDKTYGGSGEDFLRNIITTPDGGYLLTGGSYSGATGDKSEDGKGGDDYWIVKIDGNGNKVWDKTYGGSSMDRHHSTAPTSEGGYLLAGHSNSPASGDKSADSIGDTDYWIVKIDGNGYKVWDKTIGGNFGEELPCISSSADGGYLMAGSSWSDAGGDKSENSNGHWDFWLVKIDDSGGKVWDKTIGGNNTELPRSIILAPDGGYFMSGYSDSPASGDKSEDSRGGNDFWVVKLSGETMQDIEAPVIGEIAPITAKTNYASACAAELEFSATVTDNIDASVSPVFSILLDGVSTEISAPFFFPVGVTSVYVNATDAAGNAAIEQTFTVTVEDGEPPVFGGVSPIMENTDPESCTASVDFSSGMGVSDNCDPDVNRVFSILLDGVRTEISYPYTFPLGETVVYVNATDAAGNVADEASFKVTVTNPPPVIAGSLKAPVVPNFVGTTITIYDVVTDNNIASAEWRWSDGLVSPGTLIYDSSTESYLVRGQRTFANPGTFTVELQVADLCGETATHSYQHMFFVNGPDKGKVIGSGSIHSPQGAFTANTSLTGNASFFVSVENNFRNNPRGTVMFRFGRASLNFWSSNLEWMNLEGRSVQLRGEGRISGRGRYGFFLSLVEGDVRVTGRDRFRIKIWESFSGEVVYDNEMGTVENSQPSSYLASGRISIYRGRSGFSLRVETPNEEDAFPLGETGDLSTNKIEIYPNPVGEILYIDIESDLTETVTISIHDLAGRPLHEESWTIHNGPNRIVMNTLDWNTHSKRLLFRLMSPSKGLHQTILIKP